MAGSGKLRWLLNSSAQTSSDPGGDGICGGGGGVCRDGSGICGGGNGGICAAARTAAARAVAARDGMIWMGSMGGGGDDGRGKTPLYFIFARATKHAGVGRVGLGPPVGF